MNRVSARFGIEVSTSGCSHSSDAAISLSAEFLAPEIGMRPSMGPLGRIESLSMGHGYEPDFVRDKAAPRLILAGFRLSGGIRVCRLPGSFAALKVCAQGFGQPCFAALRLGHRFFGLIGRIPRHSRLSHTSPSHGEGFPLCDRLRFARNAAVAQW